MKCIQCTVSLIMTLYIVTASGCSNDDSSNAPVVANPIPSGHSHDDADKLVWVRSDISVAGFQISLGHHGEHFHTGETIEPAVAITKEGTDVDDAVLRNALISKDDSAVLVDYVPMVFEPKTEDEPAHYAQGGLKIPADAGNVQVRFELKLPGVDEAATFEIDVAFH
ncbi:MAG: hypothetical protein WAO83_04775 [Fuerstiella sp.]